jgi:hypothetical protein
MQFALVEPLGAALVALKNAEDGVSVLDPVLQIVDERVHNGLYEAFGHFVELVAKSTKAGEVARLEKAKADLRPLEFVVREVDVVVTQAATISPGI